MGKWRWRFSSWSINLKSSIFLVINWHPGGKGGGSRSNMVMLYNPCFCSRVYCSKFDILGAIAAEVASTLTLQWSGRRWCSTTLSTRRGACSRVGAYGGGHGCLTKPGRQGLVPKLWKTWKLGIMYMLHDVYFDHLLFGYYNIGNSHLFVVFLESMRKSH